MADLRACHLVESALLLGTHRGWQGKYFLQIETRGVLRCSSSRTGLFGGGDEKVDAVIDKLIATLSATHRVATDPQDFVMIT